MAKLLNVRSRARIALWLAWVLGFTLEFAVGYLENRVFFLPFVLLAILRDILIFCFVIELTIRQLNEDKTTDSRSATLARLLVGPAFFFIFAAESGGLDLQWITMHWQPENDVWMFLVSVIAGAAAYIALRRAVVRP